MSDFSVLGMTTEPLHRPAAVDRALVDPADVGRGGLPWRALLVLACATLIMVTGEMLPTAVLPQMSAGLGVSQASTGLLVSLWAAVVVVASFPLVRLTSRLGRRTVIAGSLAVFAFSSAVTALAPNYAVAVAGRTLGAAAVGLLWATVNAYAADLVPDRLLARATAVVLGGAALEFNLTNERGIDGTVRYLRNVMGLWPLQECLRAWRAQGRSTDLTDLLAAAATREANTAVIDIDDPTFLPPGDMPERIVEACRRTGQAVPTDPVGIVRCIVDSLALAHRKAIEDAVRLSGRPVEVVHLIGGGSRNELLCQATADACGLPVVAGPAEATAIGNVLVQARALLRTGRADSTERSGSDAARPYGLAELRALVRASFPTRTFRPRRPAP